MSIEAINEVLQHSKQKGTALLVMIAVANFANDEGVAWPSVRTLARFARTSRRHVQRLLESLEEAGELQVVARKGRVPTTGGVQRTHIYRLVGLVHQGGDKMTPPKHRRRKGGDTQVPKGVVPMSPYPVLEPSKVLSTKAFHRVEKRKREEPSIDISEAGMKKVMEDLRRLGVPT